MAIPAETIHPETSPPEMTQRGTMQSENYGLIYRKILGVATLEWPIQANALA
jgi:hypothetical protein